MLLISALGPGALARSENVASSDPRNRQPPVRESFFRSGERDASRTDSLKRYPLDFPPTRSDLTMTSPRPAMISRVILLRREIMQSSTGQRLGFLTFSRAGLRLRGPHRGPPRYAVRPGYLHSISRGGAPVPSPSTFPAYYQLLVT